MVIVFVELPLELEELLELDELLELLDELDDDELLEDELVLSARHAAACGLLPVMLI